MKQIKIVKNGQIAEAGIEIREVEEGLYNVPDDINPTFAKQLVLDGWAEEVKEEKKEPKQAPKKKVKAKK